MKKTVLILLTLVLCLSLSSCDKILNMAKSAVTGEEASRPPEDFIATIEGEEYTYELYDEYVKVIEYVGEGVDVTIPSEIDGKPVTTIGTLCFFEKPIVSVTIPDSVRVIENSAFYYADVLKTVTIPDTVEKLESRVFGWCNSLESVVIGRGVTEIPDFCFNHCISLTDVEIPENITKIGVRAFSYCDKLEKVVIPKTVSSVGDLAFVFSPALKFVVIENDDIELGKNILSDSPEAAIVSKVDSKSYYYCVEQKLLWTESIEATPTRLGNE